MHASAGDARRPADGAHCDTTTQEVDYAAGYPVTGEVHRLSKVPDLWFTHAGWWYQRL